MKPLATLALLVVLALPARAAVLHDEAVNGDISTDPANPTALAFAPGSNTIAGTVRTGGTTPDPRDYITFTVPAGVRLVMLNLVTYSAIGLSFIAFNEGVTSFIPSVETDAEFLAGIHIGAADVGTDLMPLFVTNNVTSNALPAPELGPGSYCFVIQQANTTLTPYRLEFVLDGSVPVLESTWGTIKRLYR
jgi:hypothetical protein